MSVILDTIHNVNSTVRLTTLPRVDNAFYEELKSLLGETFIFTGYNENRTMGLFKHSGTGVVYTLTPLLFLDHDRFFYDPTAKNVKTALTVLSTVNATAFDSNKKFEIRGGTIFSSFEKVTGNRYLVTSNNGTKMTLPVWVCKPIVDIEYEAEPVVKQDLIKDIEQAPKIASFNIERAVKTIEVPVFNIGDQEFDNEQDALIASELLTVIQNQFDKAVFSSEINANKVLSLLSKVNLNLRTAV